MGGPGSGKRAASRGGSRGGSRRGSRGGSRGGSQIRGRGGATASSIQGQLLYEEEEEQRIIDSMQGQENDSDENQMSGEEEVGPDRKIKPSKYKYQKTLFQCPHSRKRSGLFGDRIVGRIGILYTPMERFMRNVCAR